jgi:hypothetical protein
MNEIEQRVTIAERCGFEAPEWCCHEENECYLECSEYHNEQINKLPDYLNDLNAMHEAEKTLTDEQYEKYRQAVVRINFDSTSPVRVMCPITATAAQRAEAFLKTIGKWQEQTATQ